MRASLATASAAFDATPGGSPMVASQLTVGVHRRRTAMLALTGIAGLAERA